MQLHQRVVLGTGKRPAFAVTVVSTLAKDADNVTFNVGVSPCSHLVVENQRTHAYRNLPAVRAIDTHGRYLAKVVQFEVIVFRHGYGGAVVREKARVRYCIGLTIVKVQ